MKFIVHGKYTATGKRVGVLIEAKDAAEAAREISLRGITVEMVGINMPQAAPQESLQTESADPHSPPPPLQDAHATANVVVERAILERIPPWMRMFIIGIVCIIGFSAVRNPGFFTDLETLALKTIQGSDSVDIANWMHEAKKAFDQKQYAEAMQWYRKAADKGDALAMNNIGVLYDNGRGVKQDSAEAMQWFRKAADKGTAHAMYNIGALYGGGRGVKQDDLEAMQWYRKAADKGDALAMSKIGVLYDKGRGVTKNHNEALKWYRSAWDTGNAEVRKSISDEKLLPEPQ